MTDAVIEAGHLKCPNCIAPMNRHRFDSTDVRPLEVDVCYSCHAIWFDAHESARLSPDGVVELFRFIHGKNGAATARLSAKMNCARCRTMLEPASDIARNNRFSYHRCPNGHGRLTTFLHFLREKQFVRDLTLAERQKLAAHVRQIKCTSCSGPIDIAHSRRLHLLRRGGVGTGQGCDAESAGPLPEGAAAARTACAGDDVCTRVVVRAQLRPGLPDVRHRYRYRRRLRTDGRAAIRECLCRIAGGCRGACARRNRREHPYRRSILHWRNRGWVNRCRWSTLATAVVRSVTHWVAT